MKDVWNILIYILVGALLCANIYQCRREVVKPTIRTYTDTIPYYDTIPYLMPVPVDSTVITYVTKVLPVVPKEPESVPDSTFFVPKEDKCVPDSTVFVQEEQRCVQDSAEVIIPTMQKLYETDDYRAWVSGYNPKLDSLLIFGKSQTVRIYEKQMQKRWSVTIGLQAGYGITPKGWQPYAGFGVTFGWTF